jgi:anti-sigma-K factor RskA
MTDDIHALSGAYAVDGLDDLERAQFERHLAGCAACQSEVASLREAASELSADLRLAPPPAVRDRVMDDIKKVRPLPPLATPSPRVAPASTASRRWSTKWSRGLVAAAAAAILTLGGIGVWQALDDGPPTPTVAEQVLEAPDSSRVSQTFPGGATATIVRSPTLGRAVIVTSKMPAAPQGKVYQLWLQDRSGHMSSAGLMPAGSDQVVVLEGDARAATAAGISVEPAGGSAQPTSDPIALFAFT